ncbi:MAG: DUF4954 family protein [Chitinivibrionales bacterium]
MAEIIWRRLNNREIQRLKENGNRSQDWDGVEVSKGFDPGYVFRSEFSGSVRIGTVTGELIRNYKGREYTSGISDSFIKDTRIGDNACICNVRFLCGYIVEGNTVLSDIGEVYADKGMESGDRITREEGELRPGYMMDIGNEDGSKQVIPFKGMTPADASVCLLSSYDPELTERLKGLSLKEINSSNKGCGILGQSTLIKNTKSLININTGPGCVVNSASVLENITLNSCLEEPTYIGSGSDLRRGITGCGASVDSGVKADRFVLGENARLELGARFINSILSDNSCVACCEVQNSLIFPFHEQHHNNSFLIASTVMGQSNIAAGATIGSNHNSRRSDNELAAARGFWSGLCTSLKHPSCFASYTLLAKGDYPYELNITLPFSLINTNQHKNRLEIMPGYWWLYNKYALFRNAYKFKNRDKRVMKTQNIETDFLAPDTVEEILKGMKEIERITGTAYSESEIEPESAGRHLLKHDSPVLNEFDVYTDLFERSKRSALILKHREGYEAYREMALYYAVRTVGLYLGQKRLQESVCVADMLNRLENMGGRCMEWTNLGGQILKLEDLESITREIRSGELQSWDEVHERYDLLWQEYEYDKALHACGVLKELYRDSGFTESEWESAVYEAMEIQRGIYTGICQSREKDYDTSFFQDITESSFLNPGPSEPFDKDTFIKEMHKEKQDLLKVFEETLRCYR